MYKFTTSWNFDHVNSDKHRHSDEIITIPDESFTVQELLQRASANTLPNQTNYGGYNDDENISFEDDLQFFEPEDLHELKAMQLAVKDRIYELEKEQYKIKHSAELEQKKDGNLAQEEKANKPIDTIDTAS